MILLGGGVGLRCPVPLSSPPNRFPSFRSTSSSAHGFGVVLRFGAEDGWRGRGGRSEGRRGFCIVEGIRRRSEAISRPATYTAMVALTKNDEAAGPATAGLPNAAEPR